MNRENQKSNQVLSDFIFFPVAICDGDDWNINNEPLEDFFTENNIPFDRCYSLYKKNVDLSNYSTLAFFTTMTYPEKVKKLLNFDMSNLKSVIVLGEWAYKLAKPISEKLNIPLYTYDKIFNCIVLADDYFSGQYFKNR